MPNLTFEGEQPCKLFSLLLGQFPTFRLRLFCYLPRNLPTLHNLGNERKKVLEFHKATRHRICKVFLQICLRYHSSTISE